MSQALTVTKEIHFQRARGRRKVMKLGKKPVIQYGSVPRISRLMALAIRMQELVDAGEVTDYAELARLTHVSRARITQIMNLTHLAPDIQEELLFMARTVAVRAKASERMLRPLMQIICWKKQRKMWIDLTILRS